MLDFFAGLLMVTAFLLFVSVIGSYNAYRREVKITRELYRLTKQKELEALYE